MIKEDLEAIAKLENELLELKNELLKSQNEALMRLLKEMQDKLEGRSK